MQPSRTMFVLLIIGCLACTIPAVSALYTFEGIPLTVTAQGEVEGDILTFGTYGLSEPPVDVTFTLPADPTWARVYTAVWGGTEQYSGWTAITINNIKQTKFTLYGEDDIQENVYSSSHGTYFIATDASDLLHSGKNTVRVTTSRGEEGNSLDGRVYAVMVVAAVPTVDGHVTQYWVAEGNENLHGEGWAGTNPTRKDSASCSFTDARTGGVTEASLTTLMLASNEGQPDYISFNGADLGSPLSSGGDGPSPYDVSNEISFDATGGDGTPSRYVDCEVFDVTGAFGTTNTVTFERGRDLTGDGAMDTTGDVIEAEDYIHPVCAILTAERDGTAGGPVFVAEEPVAENAYDGEEAMARVTVRNYGFFSADPVQVTVLLDGTPVGEEEIAIGPDGIGEASVSWTASSGTYALSATVEGGGSVVTSPVKTLTIGTLPDLSVQAAQPVRADASGTAPEATTSPAPLLSALLGIGCAGAALLRGRTKNTIAVVLCIACLLMIPAGEILATPASAAAFAEYTLPVTVTNGGGSDVQECMITVYLDGEKAAVRLLDEGVPAHGSRTTWIPLFTTPGTHQVTVMVNEDQTIKESSYTNNRKEDSFAFP
ncbi:DUF3344 domain-containing protein [Methanogenium organophilum]|uniref:DUF3344 domain-containing protein n=1 Tax=Methanogenium organophilum TaxID=2199 RepID=A0A9X9S3K3_METOG|nr:DUF3344 domain-containing protein [Methanogenium organophilum]WAI00275.1 DUF3344 domain-containing protein [Methanogenium organophilum]